jgi:protein-tyrosine phosphatase
VLSFFRKPPLPLPLSKDIHSHLLPGLDDGVRTLEESAEVIRFFQEAGYQKLITTPHIMQDYYRNSPKIISTALTDLKRYLDQQGIRIEMEAAAEYYLDEELLKKLESGEKLMSFGQGYLLFETNMMTEPLPLTEFIFKITTLGYKPVLAHPERYAYMTMERAEDLRNRGVLFQINIPSIAGHYSKPIQKMANKLIDQGWIEFLGSDCHQALHARLLSQVQENKYYQKALALPLLNHTL